jgi:hypothetical protein
VCTDVSQGGTNDILESAGIYDEGLTQIKWRRKLVTGDSKDLPYSKGTLDVTFAYHPTSKALVQHNANTKGTASIDFSSGTAEVNDNTAIQQVITLSE